MSEIEEMKTNEYFDELSSSPLSVVTDYTKMRSKWFEQIVKEDIEVGISDKLKELYFVKEVVETVSEKLNDEELLTQLDDLNQFIRSEIFCEVKENCVWG